MSDSRSYDPFASATTIASAVRQGRYSAQQATEVTLARITQIDPALGAFTVVLSERATEQARSVHQRPAGTAHDNARESA